MLKEASIVWTQQKSIHQVGSNQQLNFTPLKTSNSGHYKCIMTIDTDVVSFRGENTTNLMVTSKYITYTDFYKECRYII